MSIGENIKKIREKRGMSQLKLAQEVGVTQTLICQIEKEIRTPSFIIAVEIAKALNCKTDDFLKAE